MAKAAQQEATDFGSVVTLPSFEDGNGGGSATAVAMSPEENDGVQSIDAGPSPEVTEAPQLPLQPVTVRRLTANDMAVLDRADTDVAEFSRRWRGYEAARRRQRDQRQMPGDGILFADVGQPQNLTDDLLRSEFARLTRIDNLLASAGSLADIEQAREVHQTAAAKLDSTARRVSAEIAELERKIADLESEHSQVAAEHQTALDSLTVMSESREKLRDLNLLPRHIVDEFNVRRAFATNEVRNDITAIRKEIADLEIEASATLEMHDGRPVNVHLIELRMNSVKADPTRTGFAFWVDRVFSLAEFANYKRWCQVRLEALRTQLEQIDKAIQAKIDASAEKLLGFYTDSLE